MEPERFRNRNEAGRLLAKKLTAYVNRPDVLVLALPRGGVPVAYEVARALGAPLDESACGIVLFAHGSGSSRFSQRHRHVAELLNREKLATLLVDLRTAELRFNIGLLAERLVGVT